jgi:3-oxoacyl-[acyl-carrier-protein] synthase II
MLEELVHAQNRGAKIYAEICGYGSASGNLIHSHHLEDSSGKSLAMTRAIIDAGMDSEDIDFVLSNGSGIPKEDVLEAQAIQSVFNRRASDIPVTAVKPVTGHLIYGSAGVEITAAVAAINHDMIPPVINLRQPDPQCGLSLITKQSMAANVRSCLFNSSGFGGQNASLVVKKYED